MGFASVYSCEIMEELSKTMKLTPENITRRLDTLQQRIEYSFSDRDLLLEALTHKSFSNENPGLAVACNERLEFLGDAVLDLVISQRTFLDYPDLHEGDLTRVRAELVREKSLSAIARRIDLGSCLMMGKGERPSGGDEKDSLLANALESLFGALFLDSDYPTAQAVVERLFRAEIEMAVNNDFDTDFKTKLQEFCQRVHHQTPDYHLVDESGPDHQRHYVVEVHLKDKSVGSGEGRSKKQAEQDAARRALAELDR